MADWADSKKIMDICLAICELKFVDDKRINEIMAEHGLEPTEYNREVLKKQLNKGMKLTVEKTKGVT